MRLLEIPSPLLSLVVASVLAQPILGSFIPDLLHSFENLQVVNKRCANPCGYYQQLCCQADEYCYTDASNQAQCGTSAAVAATTQAPAQAPGSWQYITTTYVQVDSKTVTATFSTFIPTTTCAYSLGESACGSSCCLSGQYCQEANVCVEVGGGSSGYYSNLYTVTTTITNTAGVPLRPTSNTLVTVTSTGIATATLPFQTPVGTDGSIITGTSASTSGGGLSGGAIAGIVIGVILSIIILLLICICCCFKGLLDGLLAIFGLGPRRKRRTEEVEVYESHHHSGNRPGRMSTWFGRTSKPDEEKSGWGTGATVATLLGGLALFLGLKRRNRRNDKSSTGYGSSYYSYSGSSSESSSDRRTRRSSRAGSRASRR